MVIFTCDNDLNRFKYGGRDREVSRDFKHLKHSASFVAATDTRDQ